MYKEVSISEFISLASSKQPVPGGGGVAALVSSCGAALVAMLGNLTLDKEKYPDVCEKMQETATIMSAKAQELLQYIDLDAQVFNEYMATLKLPKDNESNIEIRKNKLKTAVENATLVPLKLAEISYELMDYALFVVKYGNKNATSDGAIGAMMLKCGVLSALYNVKINLSSLKDLSLKAEIENRVKVLTSSCIAKEAEILLEVGF